MAHHSRPILGLSASILLVLLAFGCASKSSCEEPRHPAGGQSFEAAMRLICDVDQRAGVDREEDLIDAAQLRSDYLKDHVKNPDAIYYRTLWTVQPAEARAVAIRNQAASVGINRCALADTLERDGEL